MARKTILVCDNCGKEVDESRGATLRITYTDARRGSKVADLCDDCAGHDARPRRRPPGPPAEDGRRQPRPLRAQKPSSERSQEPSCGRSTMGRWDSASSRGLQTRAKSRFCSSAIWRASTTSRI